MEYFGGTDRKMHAILREHALDDHHAQFAANLPDVFVRPEPNVSDQHLVTIFRYPDDMVTMVKYAARPEIVSGHPLLFEERLLRLEDESFEPERGQ